MKNDKRKIALIGCGLVGMSFAYAALNRSLCGELVLIDIDRKRAEGEAMDLNHGIAFSGTNMQIYAGDYSDCADADIALLAAGLPQKEGEDRNASLDKNAAIFKSIISQLKGSGFNGIIVVATNPVDVMSYITLRLSGFSSERVIGTGTTLDTARLRYLLGSYFSVDPRNVHAYVMGEHGDSEFIPWTQAMISTKSVLDICDDSSGLYSYERLLEIGDEVRDAAYKIIEAKRATYYGIGMAAQRICRAILDDERAVLTVSGMLDELYGQHDVFAGTPFVIGAQGIIKPVRLHLNDFELSQMDQSCRTIKSVCSACGVL